MAYLLDTMVILILLVFALIGYHRGFVKTIIQLVGSLVALILAVMISQPLSGLIYDGFISKPVTATINDSIGSTQVDDIKTAAEDILESLPGPIVNIMESQNVGTAAEITKKLEDEIGSAKETLVSTIESQIVRPAAVALIQPLLALVLFLILLVAVHFAAKIVDKLFKLPLINKVNKVLGAVIGVVQGFLFIIIGVMILTLISHAASEDSAWSRKNIDETGIISKIENISPLTDIARSVI